MLFFCILHLDSVDRDIEGELAKSPKMVSNVQQLMFIGKILFTFFCNLLLQVSSVLLLPVPVRAKKYRVPYIFCFIHFFAVLRIRIREAGDFLTPGSGKGKKSTSGSGIRIRYDQPGSYFLELRNPFFGVKILKFFDADPGWKKRIRDPG